MKGKVSFIIGIIGLIACLFLTDEAQSTIFKISFGLVIGAIIEFIVFVIDNRKNWGTVKTLIFYRNSPVRVTIAYMFRIQVNGKYVLIKRHKKDRHGYQPIGGVYKYFREENRELFDNLGIEPCNFVPRDEDTEDDLRIVVNKRKNLRKFLKWFESRKNRELDPYREFYEELIAPGHLPEELFRHIKYTYVGKHIEGVLKSPVFPVDEVRYAEIFELRMENDAQRQAIIDLSQRGDELLFATPVEINNRAANGNVILPHTFKILPQ